MGAQAARALRGRNEQRHRNRIETLACAGGERKPTSEHRLASSVPPFPDGLALNFEHRGSSGRFSGR